jgi:transcriptional adapter 3
MLKVTRAPKKKKDKHHNMNGHSDPNGADNGTPSASATSGGNKLVLEPSEALMNRVELRSRWVSAFGSAMAEWQAQQPGRLYGLPDSSIYVGLEEDLGNLELGGTSFNTENGDSHAV